MDGVCGSFLNVATVLSRSKPASAAKESLKSVASLIIIINHARPEQIRGHEP